MTLRHSLTALGLLMSLPALAVPITAPTVATFGPPTSAPNNDVAAAGDVNFDGLDDLLLGDPTSPPNGMADMRFGGAPPGFAPPPITFLGASPGSLFGQSVDGVGDFNCDGIADIVVGAPKDAAFSPAHGAAFVFFGPFFPGVYPAPAAGLILVGEFPGDLAGMAVQLVPDVDGDACSELLVGAPGNTFAAAQGGAAYLVPSSMGLAGIFPLNFPGITKFFGMNPGDGLGQSVDTAGDYDADGIPDIIVGGPTAGGNTGQVHIIGNLLGLLGGLWPAGPVGLTIRGPGPGALFGWSVDGGMDYNFDGTSEVLIGAPGTGMTTTGVATRRGSVHLAGRMIAPLMPGAAMPSAMSTAWYQGVVNNGQLGWDVSFAGDYTGDQRPDFAASAPTVPSGGGGGLVYIRRGTGILPPPGLVGNITMAPAPILVTSAAGFQRVGQALDWSRGNDFDVAPDVLVGAWRGAAAAVAGRNLVGSY